MNPKSKDAIARDMLKAGIGELLNEIESLRKQRDLLRGALTEIKNILGPLTYQIALSIAKEALQSCEEL